MYVNKKVLILCVSLLCGFSQILHAKEQLTLNIAGWDVYSDPENPKKVIGYESFEKKTGAVIKFRPLSNLDDIITVAESGENYDVFIISNEGIRSLHDMELVKPLNLQDIPNYQNLHHNLKYSALSQFESRVYAVPWAWGPTGLMYDKDVIKNPDSWNILWDLRYKEKVGMWDDISMIWTTALSLGYKNVYSLTRKQLKAVEDKLLSFNDQAHLYYKGGNEEMEHAIEGNLVAYNSWYDPSSRLKALGKNYAMIIPKEGAVGMFDSYMLGKDSQQVKLVHQYINYQISPEVQKQMVHITGLAPSNLETLSLLSQTKIKELHLDEEDFFNRMLLWDHMPRKNLYEEVLETVRKDFKNQGHRH